MSQLIVYSLFDHPRKQRFEKLAYWRGIYFNWRMNRLIYPKWDTRVYVDTEAQAEYLEMIGIACQQIPRHELSLGEGALRRLLPVWELGVERILCRDADAITTYREARFVHTWETSGRTVHSLHDHWVHQGLMGGMIGIQCAAFRTRTRIWSFDQLIAGWDLSEHCSDQSLLNAIVLPRLEDDMQIDDARTATLDGDVPGISPSLWQSDLTCRHIGSAGVVEMELLRFFDRCDPQAEFYKTLESALKPSFPDVFYWA